MALNVGNIANNPSLDSPISVKGADTYHELRGNTAWAEIDDEVKEQLLRKATDYMIATYGRSWSAVVIAMVQVPLLMAQAAAELALTAKTTPLLSNITRGKKRVKVGPLEVEYDGTSAVQTQFVLASRKLAPLLIARNGAMVKLTRC